jgi:hypothetical protein
LRPDDWDAASRAIAWCIGGVSLFIVALDLLFRRSLPPGYAELFTSPLMPRMAIMSVMAAVEEVKFRLIGMTALAVVFSRATGKMPPALWLVVILLAQFANVGGLVLAYPLYASLRYLVVGSVWGWLYWRHGWISALIGHAACHLLLDPVLLYALS